MEIIVANKEIRDIINVKEKESYQNRSSIMVKLAKGFDKIDETSKDESESEKEIMESELKIKKEILVELKQINIFF